jgi:hypothetical protein
VRRVLSVPVPDGPGQVGWARFCCDEVLNAVFLGFLRQLLMFNDPWLHKSFGPLGFSVKSSVVTGSMPKIGQSSKLRLSTSRSSGHLDFNIFAGRKSQDEIVRQRRRHLLRLGWSLKFGQEVPQTVSRRGDSEST